MKRVIVCSAIILLTATSSFASPARSACECLVRDDGGSIPAIHGPSVGPGFAKRTLRTGVPIEAQVQCDDDLFDKLMKLYCSQNSGPGQWFVYCEDQEGHQFASCALSGCELHSCP